MKNTNQLFLETVLFQQLNQKDLKFLKVVNKFSHSTGISNPFRRIFIWGSPLDFSLSPFFQEHASILDNQKIIYSIFRGKLKDFKTILNDELCLGANITVSNKIKAIDLCNELTETARICGSINTVFKKDGKLIGDNTDGDGLLFWLNKNNILKNNVDILGNGGTSRSVAYALYKNGVYPRIFGREEKGWEKEFGTFHHIENWKDEVLTINTLPFIRKGKNIVDISYQFGNISKDAAGMLACQGWLAFKRWFDSDITLKKFIDITFTHAQAQTNSFLINNLKKLK